MSRRLSWVLACVSLSLLSCSSDAQSSRPPYRSGVTVSITTPVSSLDSQQLMQLCTSFDGYVQAQVGFDAIAYISCLPAAIVLGGSPAGCQQQLDQCIAAFPPPVMVQAQISDQTVCFANLQACEASVAALEGCVNVSLDLVLDILHTWSCGDASQQSAQEAAARAMNTASVCTDLSAACNRFATVSVQ